jgi:hypothetical protein
MDKDQGTFSNSRAFSMIVRTLCSDSRELAGLHGPVNFFSFSFATNTGSKSMNTSLRSVMRLSEVSLFVSCQKSSENGHHT